MKEKAKAASVSIFSNVLLTLIKLFAGLFSGSVSILSEAIHSAMDLVASFIAFFAVRISSKEPDTNHPYGHGKYENVSGVLEGILILIAALWIIYEAILKLLNPSEMTSFGLAIGVMFFSAIVNFFVSSYLYKASKKTNSIALEADALHLKTDVYTSAGVGLGLITIWLTDIYIFDPIFAILVALLILKEAFQLIKKAYNPLLDAGIELKEFENLKRLITSQLPKGTYITNLRARENGSLYVLDFILRVPPLMTVMAAHDICDELEIRIREKYSEVDIKIHIEPILEQDE